MSLTEQYVCFYDIHPQARSTVFAFFNTYLFVFRIVSVTLTLPSPVGSSRMSPHSLSCIVSRNIVHLAELREHSPENIYFSFGTHVYRLILGGHKRKHLIFLHPIPTCFLLLDPSIHGVFRLFLSSSELTSLCQCEQKGMDEANVVMSSKTIFELNPSVKFTECICR